MEQTQTQITVTPNGRGMTDITQQISAWLAQTGIHTGMLHLFVQHTSCSLLIQENADPAVQSDLERFLSRLVPDGDSIFQHTAEGPDDTNNNIKPYTASRRVVSPQGALMQP